MGDVESDRQGRESINLPGGRLARPTLRWKRTIGLAFSAPACIERTPALQ